MTTTQVARDLHVSSEYVRGEILAGRLSALIIDRPGKRAVYRITPEQLARYKDTYYSPTVSRETRNQ